MKSVNLIIYGTPIGKKRPRVSMKDGIVRTYNPLRSTNYENLIKHEYTSKYEKQVFDMNDPIKATVDIYFGLNKGDYGKKGLNKSGKSKINGVYSMINVDIDNILKAIFDALNVICYPDDKQIVQVEASKLYTSDTPRVEVYLERIEVDEDREQGTIFF